MCKTTRRLQISRQYSWSGESELSVMFNRYYSPRYLWPLDYTRDLSRTYNYAIIYMNWFAEGGPNPTIILNRTGNRKSRGWMPTCLMRHTMSIWFPSRVYKVYSSLPKLSKRTVQPKSWLQDQWLATWYTTWQLNDLRGCNDMAIDWFSLT